MLGLNLDIPRVLALDEIQLVPNSTSVIKSLYDKYGLKIIATGSSSFYLKNHFSESLAGRKQIFEIWPLDFEEFLWFKGIDTGKFQNEKFSNYLSTYFDLLNGKYEEFITYGGFPEVALTDLTEDKTNYLSDILNSYIELDIKLLSDLSASEALYKLIRLLANRVGRRVDFTKISGITGINRNKIKEYIYLLEYTYFIRTVKPFTTGIDKEITKQPKLYFSDTGLLQACGQIGSGFVFENAIANQLALKGEINFYEKAAGSEIDFIFNNTTAFEVKETCTAFDLKSITSRGSALKLSDYQLIGRHPSPAGFNQFIWGGNIF